MNKIIYLVFVVVFSLNLSLTVNAQESVNHKTRLKLDYQKNSENKIVLTSALTVKQKRFSPFIDVPVKFYSGIDTTRVLLGEVITNNDGIASFIISGDQEISRNDEGFMNFSVEYEGNDTTTSCSNEAIAKEAELKLVFYQKDSLKFIEVTALAKSIQEENDLPVQEVKVKFFVKGTFSLLKFNESETNENGKVEVAFPEDIPGDTAGVVSIVAKIEDDESYGTVVAMGKINWASPIQPVVEKHRGLGDTDAPLWMVYTLIILLSAVWFHYLYVIIQVIRIKLDAKKQERSAVSEV